MATDPNIEVRFGPPKRVDSVVFFKNGNIAAFDVDHNQIAELQVRSVVEQFSDAARKAGYSTEGCRFTTEYGSGWIVGGAQRWDK